MTDDSDHGGGVAPVDRRTLLAATVPSVAGGLAGCLGDDTDDSGCPWGEVEGPDGEARCVEPVETPQPVSEYYNYGGGQTGSATTPDGLSENDATIQFVYRTSDTGDRLLVVINGDATAASDGGGKVAITFERVNGYEW